MTHGTRLVQVDFEGGIKAVGRGDGRDARL